MGKAAKNFALGAILMGVAGYVVGVLTAPKSGRETREELMRRMQSGMNEAERQLKRLHTQMNSLIDRAKYQLETLQGKSRKELEEAIQKTQNVKERARMLLSGAHEGDAETSELKRAIDEANKVIGRLEGLLRRDEEQAEA